MSRSRVGGSGVDVRDLYLHIGLPKTGTTYIQKVLGENRALLAAEGLGFGPYLDPETGSHYPRFGEALAKRGAGAGLRRDRRLPG